jgi:hypothetical protein
VVALLPRSDPIGSLDLAVMSRMPLEPACAAKTPAHWLAACHRRPVPGGRCPISIPSRRQWLVLPLSIPVPIFGVAATEAAITRVVVPRTVLDPVRAVVGQFRDRAIRRRQPAARSGPGMIQTRTAALAQSGVQQDHEAEGAGPIPRRGFGAGAAA